MCCLSGLWQACPERGWAPFLRTVSDMDLHFSGPQSPYIVCSPERLNSHLPPLSRIPPRFWVPSSAGARVRRQSPLGFRRLIRIPSGPMQNPQARPLTWLQACTNPRDVHLAEELSKHVVPPKRHHEPINPKLPTCRRMSGQSAQRSLGFRGSGLRACKVPKCGRLKLM